LDIDYLSIFFKRYHLHISFQPSKVILKKEARKLNDSKPTNNDDLYSEKSLSCEKSFLKIY
jgi:hypothetical protein